MKEITVVLVFGVRYLWGRRNDQVGGCQRGREKASMSRQMGKGNGVRCLNGQLLTGKRPSLRHGEGPILSGLDVSMRCQFFFGLDIEGFLSQPLYHVQCSLESSFLMVMFGRNFILMFLAIGAVEWLTMARIVRGQTLSLKNKEFIEAARASGGSTFSIIARHIVPNVLGVVIVYVTLTIPQVILLESFLSFLGLGVQEPLTSWGVLLNEGAAELEANPRTLIVPAAFMTVTLFCFNFIGDGLRDALDPKDR